MEFRNAAYNEFGDINCEVNDPMFGWVPYTASSSDTEQSGRDLFNEILASNQSITAYSAPDPSIELGILRSTAFVTKQAFCRALKDAGVLPPAEAKLAAKGGWPDTFAGYLSSLTDDEAVNAEIEWAGAANIHRNHPMIIALAPEANLSTEQVDALFGIGV